MFIPTKKVYLQLINGRSTALTVDSSDVAADKSFKFKSAVVDGGGYYILNFFAVDLSQKILLILEGGETLNVIADGMDTPTNEEVFS